MAAVPATSAPAHPADCDCPVDSGLFYTIPDSSFAERTVSVPYHNALSVGSGGDAGLLKLIMAQTPTPKGRDAFSSVHVVAPPLGLSSVADATVTALERSAPFVRKQVVSHRLSGVVKSQTITAMQEYQTIFEMASSLILSKADRASLVVYVGWEDVAKDALAGFIGMLPFRGVQLALLSRREEYGSFVDLATESGVFQYDAADAGRMGMYPIKAIFGPLPDAVQETEVEVWSPVKYDTTTFADSIQLPFKIGGLELPMITHNGSYDDALDALAEAVSNDFAKDGGFFPIVSCGETCDALGYGTDVLNALDESGFYFNHHSGETYKRYQEYGSTALFAAIAKARRTGLKPVIIAVGGGVNGNCIGLIAALTGADFIEVPTTPMHYNDATTSAKKAFSLVVDDVILSKNILGAFYLPRLVFCVSEMLLTSSAANIHATIGESTKTMNMLGVSNSKVGAADYHNILGATEFASDFTKIVKTVGGFDKLIEFIEAPSTKATKRAVLKLGQDIAELRSGMRFKKTRTRLISCTSTDSGQASGAQSDEESSGCSSLDDVSPTDEGEMSALDRYAEQNVLLSKRRMLMLKLRDQFKELSVESQADIKEFLTVVNKEIVAAKAMFLAYSDPFEKYRALLFEYAHTLGHGVEAFANKLYAQCAAKGIQIPESAFRLHGQCVGMAVLWAGWMSFDLGVLKGHGLDLHQSLVYLFNRHGGFSFGPLRELCDSMGVTKDEFCEGVIAVVRRDNKRGYCAGTSDSKSVDQLVAGRPGKMLRSEDANAELRYLVEVDEDMQREVLGKAFDGAFDRVADLRDGKLSFIHKSTDANTESSVVGEYIHSSIAEMYSA